MKITHRPYRDKEDLLQIGQLLRRAHAQAPYSNAWSFARFDIWAQLKIGDDQVHGKRDWQQGIHLWEMERGELAGAVMFANNQSAALVYDPDVHQIVEPMLSWAEARYTENGGAGKPLTIEARASNAYLE